ncbi:unnamed protein product [Soboliphyme baturini]|uniref:Aldedh domain-containing protein n=1 Tax=Soboliphyme baturini TaxID=241478 RepID=A0A183J3J0_9BILA|nr:unnamed protein product [Soboliphyme baturini]
MTACIDSAAFDSIKSYIDHAHSSPKLKIIGGGKCDRSKGYYIEPTIVECSDPSDKIMKEEIFGPVLAVYPFPDSKMDEVLSSVKDATPFGLTGSVFATDKEFIKKALVDLRYAAGNFYINDKSTGAVVNQQPFGGARHSGTNDKAGGPHFILKWTSALSVKETHVPMNEWRHPYMD